MCELTVLVLKQGHYISNTNQDTLAFSEYLLHFSQKKAVTSQTQNTLPRSSHKLSQILRFTLDDISRRQMISHRFELNIGAFEVMLIVVACVSSEECSVNFPCLNIQRLPHYESVNLYTSVERSPIASPTQNMIQRSSDKLSQNLVMRI